MVTITWGKSQERKNGMSDAELKAVMAGSLRSLTEHWEPKDGTHSRKLVHKTANLGLVSVFQKTFMSFHTISYSARCPTKHT